MEMGRPGPDTVADRGPRILRARRGSRGVQEGPEDRREGRQDDEYAHPAAVRVLFPAVLFAQERHPVLQVREPGRDFARRQVRCPSFNPRSKCTICFTKM